MKKKRLFIATMLISKEKKKDQNTVFKMYFHRRGNNTLSPSIVGITFVFKFFHSSTASSRIFSWSWATARRRAQRCQTVVIDLPMVALLASFPDFSNSEVLSSRATIFSWKELTTDTKAWSWGRKREVVGEIFFKSSMDLGKAQNYLQKKTSSDIFIFLW